MIEFIIYEYKVCETLVPGKEYIETTAFSGITEIACCVVPKINGELKFPFEPRGLFDKQGVLWKPLATLTDYQYKTLLDSIERIQRG